MKTYLLIPTLVLGLAGCSVEPLSSESTQARELERMVLTTCYTRGWVYNPAATEAYISYLNSILTNRGNPADIAKVRQAYGNHPVNVEHCRQADMAVQRHARETAEQQQQAARASANMDEFYSSMQQLQQQNRPVTTMCNSSPWGGMTTCSSF